MSNPNTLQLQTKNNPARLIFVYNNSTTFNLQEINVW